MDNLFKCMSKTFSNLNILPKISRITRFSPVKSQQIGNLVLKKIGNFHVLPFYSSFYGSYLGRGVQLLVEICLSQLMA